MTSTYTPFHRWFTNERQREIDEVWQLYLTLKAAAQACPHSHDSVTDALAHYFDDLPLYPAIRRAISAIVAQERYLDRLQEPKLDSMSLTEFVEFRNLLYAKQYFYANQAAVIKLLMDSLGNVFSGLTKDLPEVEAPAPFTIPLIHALPEPRWMVEATSGTLQDYTYLYDRGLLRPLIEQFRYNECVASGRDPGDQNSRKPIVSATESKLPMEQMVDAYMGHTPFRDFFMTPVPLKLTHEDRMNHMMVVGGPGSGKSSLIETLFLHDTRSPDEPSIVIIDPHSDMLQRILRADLGIEDRIIYISPKDAPGLNPFALNRERLAGYDEHTKEQVMAGVIQTFNYLFSGLAGGSGELTTKQQILFTYSAQLLLSFPETMGRNATILDLLGLLHDHTPFKEAIARLPQIPREFFERDFVSSTFGGTKEELRYRLQGIIASPTMTRLFTAEETTIDVFAALNSGKIILVDTAKDHLKDGSAAFGKLFISIVLQSVLERAAIPMEQRRDTFLIVDEASDFFSNNVDDLLTEVRKFRCGCLFAFQYLSQSAPSLRASLLGTTGIKFAASLSAHDARVMGPEMRTTSDFIMEQPRLHFAAYVRHVTPQAISIPIVPGAISRMPRISGNAYDALIAANRARVSSGPARPGNRPGLQSSDPPVPPDEDISENW